MLKNNKLKLLYTISVNFDNPLNREIYDGIKSWFGIFDRFIKNQGCKKSNIAQKLENIVSEEIIERNGFSNFLENNTEKLLLPYTNFSVKINNNKCFVSIIGLNKHAIVFKKPDKLSNKDIPNFAFLLISINKEKKLFTVKFIGIEEKILQNKSKENERVIGLDLSYNYFFVASDSHRCPWFFDYYRECENNKGVTKQINHLKTFVDEEINRIVENYDVVVVKKPSDDFYDNFYGTTLWNYFISKLKHILEIQGKTLVYVDESSEFLKTCSQCGHKILKLEEDIDYWKCENCDKIHNRNVNVSQNLVNYYIQNKDQVIPDMYKTELKIYNHPKFQEIDYNMPKSKNKKRQKIEKEYYNPHYNPLHWDPGIFTLDPELDELNRMAECNL